MSQLASVALSSQASDRRNYFLWRRRTPSGALITGDKAARRFGRRRLDGGGRGDEVVHPGDNERSATGT
ncbi:hypothetical protein EYF80_063620 [Liparis tanakae]|uniref:Uncharacterized protein n=1 Tax=Liparis tanakae TaxID=230148 RepID=A0A4Z2EBY9_9TELE|nr:hypothetical protein EYF80_063620 [Liparis tanakae]